MHKEGIHLEVEAVVFDLGGVLIELDFDRAFAHWAACASVAPETLRSRFRMDEAYERHERGEIDAAEYFRALRASLGLELTDEQIGAGWGSIFIREVPGIAPLLRRLSLQRPLDVFSNSNAAHEAVWSRQFAKTLEPFREVFVSSRLGKRKPTPEAFHAVAQAIDVPPERVLFFDDTAANVAGARAVGMQAVRVGSLGDIESALKERAL
ncbi:MAG: HAD family hydrolase [Bacillota bacterium]